MPETWLGISTDIQFAFPRKLCCNYLQFNNLSVYYWIRDVTYPISMKTPNCKESNDGAEVGEDNHGRHRPAPWNPVCQADGTQKKRNFVSHRVDSLLLSHLPANMSLLHLNLNEKSV